MNKRPVIWTLVSIGLLLATLFAVLAFRTNRGDFSLENRAREAIARAAVQICHQKFEFGEIPPGEARTATFKIRTDSHYDVAVEFKSGRAIDAHVGYVTSGANFNDKLIVKDNEVVLETGPIR
jgi:hypothetical protein